jgi:hypothetical protein
MKYKQFFLVGFVSAILFIGLFSSQAPSIEAELAGLHKAYEAGLISVDELKRYRSLLFRSLLR